MSLVVIILLFHGAGFINSVCYFGFEGVVHVCIVLSDVTCFLVIILKDLTRFGCVVGGYSNGTACFWWGDAGHGGNFSIYIRSHDDANVAMVSAS